MWSFFSAEPATHVRAISRRRSDCRGGTAPDDEIRRRLEISSTCAAPGARTAWSGMASSVRFVPSCWNAGLRCARRFLPPRMVTPRGSPGRLMPTRLRRFDSNVKPAPATMSFVPVSGSASPLAAALFLSKLGRRRATRVPGSACRQARSQRERAAGDPCGCPCSCPRTRTYLPAAP